MDSYSGRLAYWNLGRLNKVLKLVPFTHLHLMVIYSTRDLVILKQYAHKRSKVSVSVFSFSAKLGDTKELEDFIADLDKTLESEC